MKPFLKTLIGGALGLGALYVVGKICYEAGRESKEIEQILQKGKELSEETNRLIDIAKEDGVISEDSLPESEPKEDELSDAIDEAWEKNSKPTFLGRMTNRVRNAKIFLLAKKTFDRSNKSPGILSSLLTNPDGARIEAVVRDGGIQISVKPRAA